MESHPQVESIARIESTISTTDAEPIDAEKKPIHISIRLIGDKGIGKASIVDRYLGRKTEEEQASSSKNPSTDTAVDQGLSQEYSSSITVDGREVILHIWSGTISKDFEWHPLAVGVINEGLMFVFDSTDESSYESIKQQFSIYYSAGDYSNRVDKPEVILVGTNCRTDNKIRFYDWVLSELIRYTEDHTGEKFIGYYETNFESGANLREVFDVLINKVLDNCDPTRREILSPIESPPAKATTKIDFVNPPENRQATRSDRKLLRQNLNKAKRQHGKIPVRFLKVFFTGSGAAGKTSFVRLLLKKKFNEFHHSTNVIHTNHAVSVNMVAFQGAPTKKVTWVELDSSLELGYLRSVLLSPPSKALSHPPSPSTARGATVSLAENTSTSRPVESQGYQTPLQPESTIKSFFAGLFASSVKVSDLATFENLVSLSTGNKFEYQPGKVLNIITLLDTGGQPEYIHLLPTINIYPTVTFVVHNLAKNLTDQVLVEFSQHGKLVFAPYHLSYTNLDMIKLLMSAANDSVERPTSRIPQLVTKPGINNKSFICLVGTHVDEVSPDLVKKTDKALTKLVRKTQCEAAVWQKANGNVLFSVDNTTSGNESLAEDPVADEMRKRIESLAAEKEVYELPITWMLLELEIQQICTKRKKAYISFQECVIVARDTGLISDEEEVRSVLQYHHLLGVLIYFEEVPGLCNYVIVDHQWWFDKLSGIICITFQQGSNNFHAVQKLKYQGILSKDLLKHVEWKDDIKEDYFLSLLTHMKIIAPLFSDKRKKGERGKQGVKKEYFIPYVLPTYSFSKKKDEILKQYGHLLGEPLLIQFKSGLLPRGLFCSLIVELLQHPLKNWEPHFSNDRKSHTFSNLITFSLPNAYSLSLLDKVSYLEVQIRHPEEDVQIKLREEALSYPIHNKVYNYLVYAITEVCIRLNFCDDRLQYGFLCQNCEYSENHIAVLPLSSSSLTHAKCSIDSLHQMKMTSSNTIWFFRDQTAKDGELSRSISMAFSVDSSVSVNLPLGPGVAPHYDRILSVPDATVPTHQMMSQIQLGRFHSVPSHSINQSSARSSQSTNLEGYSESNLHEMTHSVSSMAIDGPTGATIESTVATSQQSIDSRYTRYVSVPAGVNPNHPANLLGVYGRSISVPQPHHQFTHGVAHSTSNLVFDDTDQQPTDRPSMKLLHEIVIPKIAARWSTVADYLEYEVEFKEIIAVDCHHKEMDCCAYLLQDWLVNNRGVSPKSWSTLIRALREIKPLAGTVEIIVEELKQRGINTEQILKLPMVQQGKSSHDVSLIPCVSSPVSTIDSEFASVCSALREQLPTYVPDSFRCVKDKEYKTSIPPLSGEKLRLLTALNFSGRDIVLQHPNLIARVLMETVSLKNLDLSRTMLTSDGATKLIGALRNISSLKVFNLNNNDIDDEASESIAAVISSNTLIESINLSHNRLSYVGEVVNISDNFSKSINLATALSKCAVLQELNVSHNFLGFTDVLTVAKIFRYHPTLETLDLSSNNISFSSACKFVVDVILSVNQKLVTLNVCGKNIRPRYIDDYLSPPKSKNNSTTFALQTLSIQCSSLNLGNQTDFIKATETCPIYSDDITSYHVDHVGGVFYNECHNFALVIPPDAIAQGDCVEIQGTANYFGTYMIPDGFYPISSCYWISANYVFKTPVYFIMNHYTKIRSLEDVRNLYVLHKCAQEPNVNEDMMMSIMSDGVYFDHNIRYCVLATNHFCSYCQAKSVEHIPEYLTACYCTYDESHSESHIAEVSFCPSSSECRKVIMEQCERRNTKLQHSETFDICDGDELYISLIDRSNVNSDHWILSQRGKLTITHLGDFKYWRIFCGLTIEQIKEREELFEYPPRLQIKCKQMDASKPLYCSFKISKRSKNREIPIAQFLLDKKATVTSETVDAAATAATTITSSNTSEQTEVFNEMPEMFDLTKIVIPKIMNEWEYIAEALRYDLATIKAISEKGGVHDQKKCCREFFKDWLMTNNGAKAGPKVWSTLFKTLKQVDEISADTIEYIIEEVKQLHK